MRPVIARCAGVRAWVVLALLVLSAWRAAGQPVVAERLSDRAQRYFPSAEAKEEALPSYALLETVRGRAGEVDASASPRFETAGGKQVARLSVPPGTSMYGTGEVGGPLLRNGRTIVCWNTDAYGYGADTKSLYQSHPWVLAVMADGTSKGVLADTTYRCEVDTGATSPDEIRFVADGPSFGVVVIDGASPQEVLTELARLTGTMPLPPKWALGYHQCRYSYYPDSRVREIAAGFRVHGIPADVIWMDIDYMEAFRVFTFDRGYFPDPARLNADLKSLGFHNVWMIDPGMKADDARGPADRPEADLAKEPESARAAREEELARYRAIMASGRAADVFVKTAGGEEYRGAVWPGMCVFPDYTAPRVREWWANLYGPFLANGVAGVWNDMNEPAVFNVESKTMPLDNRHEGDPAMVGPNGKPQGARAAGDHARYHNVYGMQMIRGTREGILAERPAERPFVLSRANYIGGQRYGATWTGDNTASWEHLEMSIPMTLNVGLSGQPFIGPDIGGFVGNGDAKLFARWIGFGALLPFARGHTGKETIAKEPWAFDEHTTATAREAIQRRYRLMPYYYTLFREASVTGLPVARPVFFADPSDPALRAEDDAFLLGSDVLVIPNVLERGARAASLPKGEWRAIEVSDNPDLPELRVRAGAIVPMGPDLRFTGEKPLNPLTLVVAPDASGNASGVLYEDAGNGFEYQQGGYLLSTYEARVENGVLTLALVRAEGRLERPTRRVVVRVVLGDRVVEWGGVDGATITVPLR
ncbi:MAG: glycoside hydrolase family 31 protein [Planctomycetota bacterium]|nr:glycoside hydrolase family 31 protein [Planctomycetota bacterium]